MNTERDKFLTEAIGEKPYRRFFVSTDRQGGSGDGYYAKDGVKNDFSTWPGFGKLWEWAHKQGWWHKFAADYLDGYMKFEKYIHPDRFANAIYEHLKPKG